jgi:hypothetical protein
MPYRVQIFIESEDRLISTSIHDSAEEGGERSVTELARWEEENPSYKEESSYRIETRFVTEDGVERTVTSDEQHRAREARIEADRQQDLAEAAPCGRCGRAAIEHDPMLPSLHGGSEGVIYFKCQTEEERADH